MNKKSENLMIVAKAVLGAETDDSKRFLSTMNAMHDLTVSIWKMSQKKINFVIDKTHHVGKSVLMEYHMAFDYEEYVSDYATAEYTITQKFMTAFEKALKDELNNSLENKYDIKELKVYWSSEDRNAGRIVLNFKGEEETEVPVIKNEENQ